MIFCHASVIRFIFLFRWNYWGLTNHEAYAEFLRAIAYKKTGKQPGRSEPRMVKRRPKAFPRLQKARHFYHKEAA